MTKLFLSIFVALFACNSNAIEIKTENFNLGKVNGEVTDGRFQTNQNLKFTNIFRFDKSNSDKELSAIVIKNSLIKKVRDYMLTIETSQHNMSKQVNINYSVNLYYDGKKSRLRPLQVGRDVHLLIDKGSDIVKLDVVNPVTININHNYKGEFTMALDIEGLGE